MDVTSIKNILVASDDPKIRELIKVALVSEGYELILCGDGQEALDSASVQDTKAPSLQLIVLESFLPKIDGFEVVNKLQELKHARMIPVLMLIGRMGEDRQHHANSAGLQSRFSQTKIRLNADEYLQKPFEAEEIQGVVHSMVKHYRPHATAHSVTGLMGHPQTEQEVFARLNRGETFGMLCMDINYFRPFNDHCGTERGNEVIKKFQQLIHKTISAKKNIDGSVPFIAHVDGDDFIVLLSVEKANEIRQQLREEFRQEILEFYSDEERKKGFFLGKDRQMKERVFPLMDLSTAVLNVSMETFVHYGQLVSEANDLLRQAKVGAQDVR